MRVSRLGVTYGKSFCANCGSVVILVTRVYEKKEIKNRNKLFRFLFVFSLHRDEDKLFKTANKEYTAFYNVIHQIYTLRKTFK